LPALSKTISPLSGNPEVLLAPLSLAGLVFPSKTPEWAPGKLIGPEKRIKLGVKPLSEALLGV
jgi:hypothetical protein